MPLLTETMTAAADTTQPQAPNDGGDGGNLVWGSPGAFLVTPRVPPYKWGGWLWANQEDGAAWWKVATQGPYYQTYYRDWWWIRAYWGGSWVFLVVAGIIGGVETGLYLKTMAVYTLFISAFYGECCWRLRWNDDCITLTSGIFTLPRRVQEEEGEETEAEDVTDDEDDNEGDGSDATGHAKTD